jgi:hypothetical protein
VPDRDLVLLETVRTHRTRLVAAFLFGQLPERRTANDNLKRLVGGIVLAAVVSAGCVGFSFFASFRANQAAAQQQQAGLGPATGPAFATDTFDRRGSDGWGRAEQGGRWTSLGSTGAHAVEDGTATLELDRDEQRGGYLASAQQDHADVTVTLQRSSDRGTDRVSVLGRRVSRTQDYRATVTLGSEGAVSVSLRRRADPSSPDDPPESPLSDTVSLLGASATDPGGPPPAVSVRLQVVGTNPTVVRAKVWQAGGGEPTGWTVSASDSTSGLQRPGAVGLTAVTREGEPDTLSVLDVVARVAP